ncbi:hypothetical protein B0H13DRAFT_41748 [Mycena leptocephala]|nr:hypothetical protein B0H13DRAFT_41748 [Mycena leptocephala]
MKLRRAARAEERRARGGREGGGKRFSPLCVRRTSLRAWRGWCVRGGRLGRGRDPPPRPPQSHHLPRKHARNWIYNAQDANHTDHPPPFASRPFLSTRRSLSPLPTAQRRPPRPPVLPPCAPTLERLAVVAGRTTPRAPVMLLSPTTSTRRTRGRAATTRRAARSPSSLASRTCTRRLRSRCVCLKGSRGRRSPLCASSRS